VNSSRFAGSVASFDSPNERRITAREISHFRRERHRCWPRDSGDSRRGGDMTKIVALTLVIGVLVAGSAIFAKNHPRALAACVTNCE